MLWTILEEEKTGSYSIEEQEKKRFQKNRCLLEGYLEDETDLLDKSLNQ